MKNRTNQLNKLGFIFGLTVLSLTSCEKNEVQQENVDGLEGNSIIEMSSYEELENEPIFVKAFGKISKKITKSGQVGTYSRTSGNKLLDFKIDSSNIKIVKDKYYTSYNIPVSRSVKSKDYFENLVILLDSVGKYESYLVKYYPDAPITTINEHASFTFNGKIDIKPIDYEIDTSMLARMSYQCIDVTIWYCNWGGEEHIAGANCTESYMYTKTTSYCDWVDDGGSGGGSTGGDPGGSTGGGTSSGGDGDTGGTSKPIGPVVITDEMKYDAFYSDLEPIYKSWLDNHSGQEDIIKNFLSSNDFQLTSKSLVYDFLSITTEVLNSKFERYLELTLLISDNPWALIQDCAQQSGMDTSNYIDLYNHTIPQECQTRLDNLGFGYSNQPISMGNVPCANVDYYGVEVTNYPDFNNDGNPDTEAEIYQAFREKFTDLASGEKDDFQFSCNVPTDNDNIGHISWEFLPYNDYDLNLWNSQQNPITAIIGIDGGSNEFDFDLASDDGAIMISQYDNNSWIGSTITTPITGSQPFSGNREWGWLINQNGNLEFFTRAVDVAKVSALVKALSFGSDPCQQDTYYNIAEVTWTNMQDEIKEWIENEGGGQASINTPKAVRIDKEKIVEILTTNESIGQILSNCN